LLVPARGTKAGAEGRKPRKEDEVEDEEGREGGREEGVVLVLMLDAVLLPIAAVAPPPSFPSFSSPTAAVIITSPFNLSLLLLLLLVVVISVGVAAAAVALAAAPAVTTPHEKAVCPGPSSFLPKREKPSKSRHFP